MFRERENRTGRNARYTTLPVTAIPLMLGPVRESYNAKGRQSTAGSRKKGKIRKDKTQKNEPQEDSNANILTLESKEEKDEAKKKKLLEEVHTSYFLKCSQLDPSLSLQPNQKRNGQARKRRG